MADHHPERQSAIDAHGIIGDMRSAALVNDKGSVDFFCWPEFDSPSIFCSLLDTPEAGIFQLAPGLARRPPRTDLPAGHQRAANPLAQ